MRIEKIQLRQIGVFDEDEIIFKKRETNSELAEIHIITGKNGTGKSTLLGALASGFNYNKQIDGACFFTNNKLSYKFNKNSNINLFTDLCESGTRVYYCPNGQEHLHIEGSCDLLKNYYMQQGINWSDTYINSFAAFAYAGNKIFPFNPIKTYYKDRYYNDNFNASNLNPLFEALEFEKNEESPINIHAWILEMKLKMGYGGNEIKNEIIIEEYKYLFNKWQHFLTQVLETPVEFILDDRLDTVKLKFNDKHKFEFEFLADGTKSLISWLLNLSYRLNKMKWVNNTPLFNRNFVLFLDEIDTHLHISWQRRILPFLQELFPKSQIFITTHSPFIVNSIDGAWIYKLELNKDSWKVDVKSPIESNSADTYEYIKSEIFELDSDFGIPTENDLEPFYEMLKDSMISKEEIIKKGKVLINKYHEDDLIINRINYELSQL